MRILDKSELPQNSSYQFKVYIEREPGDKLDDLYSRGFLQSRIGKNIMYQARSIRIDLDKYQPRSENRRVLRKSLDLLLEESELPDTDYNYEIGKIAIDFYKERFGDKTFSAQKLKWIFTSGDFNTVFRYRYGESGAVIAYCPALSTPQILHYAYPFYDIKSVESNIGMAMMLLAINHAKEKGKKYIYLGSCQDEKALYKTQFKGVEWFDGEKWSDDIDRLKELVRS